MDQVDPPAERLLLTEERVGQNTNRMVEYMQNSNTNKALEQIAELHGACRDNGGC